MSLSALLYIVALGLVFVAERLLEGYDAGRLMVDLAGVAAMVVGVSLLFDRFRKSEESGRTRGMRVELVAYVAGMISLGLYALSLKSAGEFLGFEDEALQSWQVIWTSLWPILCLCASLVVVVLDVALKASPVIIAPRRVEQAVANALIAAFGIALIFPLNYVASREHKRWELAYFKTAKAGSATQNIIETFEEPVQVRVFLARGSELREDVESYFLPLEGPKLKLEFLDQATEPELARKLNVRENGIIAFTVGDLSKAPEEQVNPHAPKPEAKKGAPVTRTLRLGKNLQRARDKLRKLDEEVQKHLLELSQGERVAYLTEGHDELAWDVRMAEQRRISGMRQVLEAMNFRIKRLGLKQGLSEEVPADADVVIVLGPQRAFLDQEVEALERYVDRGGALMVGIEPQNLRERAVSGGLGDDPLLELLKNKAGVEVGRSFLAAEKGIVPIAKSKVDRANIVTDRFSSHPSTAVLSRSAPSLFLFTPTAAALTIDKKKTGPDKPTITVRSLPDVWEEKNGNLEFDSDLEKKSSRPIAVVVELAKPKKGEASPGRMLVVGDATLFSDVAIRNQGNQQFIYDGLNWLMHTESLSGTVESEEDVRIQHNKEGQTGWFYLTVLGLPLFLFGLGIARVVYRRKGEVA